MLGAKVPFIAMAGSALRTPMQLGPTRRMPWRRTISTSFRSFSIPSPPTSRNPALITHRPRMPFRPQDAATSSTSCLGTQTMARSTGSGIDSTSGHAFMA